MFIGDHAFWALGLAVVLTPFRKLIEHYHCCVDFRSLSLYCVRLQLINNVRCKPYYVNTVHQNNTIVIATD